MLSRMQSPQVEELKCVSLFTSAFDYYSFDLGNSEDFKSFVLHNLQILRVAAKEADIAWQELDTSEASAPGGPFPQIDASEFTYDIVLFESVGRIVSSYRLVSCHCFSYK